MEEQIKALSEIFNNYDAYFVTNKYGDKGTHDKEFKLLNEALKDDKKSLSALNWIKNLYDCYYSKEYLSKKDETQYDENSAFYYLEKKIKGE